MALKNNLILGATLALALAAAGAAGAEERRITVAGEGVAAAAPDMARIRLGVREEARTADEALARMSEAGAAILAELVAAGVAEADVQTSGLSLYPAYENSSAGERRVTGFIASTNYAVNVRALGDLGEMLDVLVRAGANEIGGIQFDIADAAELRDAARRAAVADAMARASLYADAAEVTLGAVMRIDEQISGGGPVPMMEMRMMDAAGSVPVAEGEVGIEAQVTMVFAIE